MAHSIAGGCYRFIKKPMKLIISSRFLNSSETTHLVMTGFNYNSEGNEWVRVLDAEDAGPILEGLERRGYAVRVVKVHL